MKTTFKNTYGEWALITGATSGIGKALAMEIAKKGIKIILVARRRLELEETALEIAKKHQVETCVIEADLTEKDGVKNVINETGKLNIGMLVLSAGIENNGSFIKSDIETELKVIDLNIISTIKLTHHFAQKMEAQKKGGILFVSSLTAHMPSPFFSNYASTKSYILNFGSSLYAELKSKGIDVSILSPGVTNTPMSEKTGIDWTKTKVQTMDAKTVAEETIKNFGDKLSIIPGKGNRIMAFMAKKVIPTAKLAVANQKMMLRILAPDKL
jgi:short-subunit dehydrogenase